MRRGRMPSMKWPQFELRRILLAIGLFGAALAALQLHEAGVLGTIVFLSAAIGVVFKRPISAIVTGVLLAVIVAILFGRLPK